MENPDYQEVKKRPDRPKKLNPGVAYLFGLVTAILLWLLFYVLAILIPALQGAYRRVFCRPF